jgi:competence protein ComFC
MSCLKYIIVVAKFQASGYNFGMSDLFGQFIDLVFPPRCTICKNKSRKMICDGCLSKVQFIRSPMCRICGKPKDRFFAGDLCGECVKGDVPFAMARSVVLYGGVIKEAIHKFKFEGKKALASSLGRFLVSYLANGEIPAGEIDLIIPLPLSGKRENQRGHNQSKLLAEEISGFCSINLDSTSLKKIKDTTPQFELSRKERLLNVKGAFRCAPLTGSNVLLIDDIYTTGATVSEASKALKASGAKKVYVLTLARTVDPEVK